MAEEVKVLAVIPARYASSRLPGKPLVEIAGKAMIQRVYERVQQAAAVDRLIVATDDERIERFVRGFGGEVMMTSSDHPSGTDRVAAVAASLDAEIVVSVQGDEPMIDPAVVAAAVDAVASGNCDCATPVTPVLESRDLFDIGVVKVVLRTDGTPLYFSRSPIPCLRDYDPDDWLDRHAFFRHIGVYAYRRQALERFVAAPVSALEQAEGLEQLRMLELGMTLHCVMTDYNGHAVDTAEDVMHVEKLLSLTPEG